MHDVLIFFLEQEEISQPFNHVKVELHVTV